MVPLFVELCAGTAAVSLRLARSKARPPVSRMGAKTGYANAILARMGLQAGQGAASYLWAEPDPGVQLLLHAYTYRQLAQDAAAVVRSWAEEDPRALWERLRAEGPVKAVEPRELARWAYVGNASWRKGDPGSGYDSRRAEEQPATDTGGRQPALTEALPPRFDALPKLPGCIVPDATKVKPAQLPAGAWVYIDPPYVGTTGYAHDLPRSEVLRLARLWHQAGAHVAISEAEPLAELVAEGWHAHCLARERIGQKRTFSKQQAEWLTLSRPPMGQLGLL